jgi:hypothetical protein
VTAAGIGAVATADLTQLAVAGKVPQLGGSGLISTTQIPALTSAQIAQITPSVIGAVATSDLTALATPGKVPQLDGSGFLSTAQLADIAGLPVGAVGSSTVVPVITTDTKGRITNLTTAQITGGGASGVTSFSAGLTGLTPNTATTGAVTLAGTLSVLNGGTGVTTSTGANSTVLRDANQNITANAYFNSLATITASGTPVTLTLASAPVQLVTGSGGQVITLPNATTLPNGTIFSFNNNQSGGAITVNNNSNTLIVSVPSGGYTTVVLLSNATAAGSWDRHDQSPSNVSWSTNTFDYAGSITSATWNGNAVAVGRGGTGATSQAAALTSLGAAPLADVMHRSVEYSTTTLVAGSIDVGGTFTITATGTYSPDGTAISVGQVVIFTAQGSTLLVQNGPWQCTNAGGAGVSAAFQRPSWFSGTVRSGMYAAVRFGTARAGFVYSLIGPVGTSDIVVGSSSVTIIIPSQRSANAIISTNTFTGRQTLAANSATINPLSFSATTGIALLTTQQLGALEWDNTQMYITNSTQLAGLARSPIATAQALINAQTGTTYTVTLTDAGYLVTLSNAAAIALGIPTDASVAFPIGTQILVMQLGAGQVTVAAVTPGTTSVNSKNGTKTAGQYAIVSLIKVAANSWVVGGDATV